MIFESWLEMRGYSPIEKIKANYKSNGFSEEETQESIERIERSYRHWCTKEGKEPMFQNRQKPYSHHDYEKAKEQGLDLDNWNDYQAFYELM